MPGEIRPLSSEASVSPATIDSASTKSEKYSQGPNSSANAASGPVATIRNIAAEQPAEERRPDAEPDRAARLALPRHREAVERGRDRRGRARDAEQARGDEPAGRAADVDAGHRGEPRSGSRPKVKGSTDDDRHGDGDAGQRAADHADRGAENSGTRYFSWRTLARPSPSSSNMAQKPGPGAARQQHDEVASRRRGR